MSQRGASTPGSRFAGFEELTANFIYCPNQFFEVCLPNSSRNVVRLVAYMLYRTLGWLDREGNPIEQQVRVTYAELIGEAGISRGAIQGAVQQAIAARFIVCTQRGTPKSKGQAGQTASYMLRWDEAGEYTNDAHTFRGFFAGQGHRTPIPNSFFERVVPGERLAVSKVVGTVLRHTVGYQTQFGGRRESAPLSYSYLQRYAKLSDRSSLSEAITIAIDKGYIRQVAPGVVDPQASRRRPATYAIRWRHAATSGTFGSKTRPAAPDRFKNQTSNGSAARPADAFKNQTNENTSEKDTYKQQPDVVEKENLDAYPRLIEAGFERPAALQLSANHSAEQIGQQIDWFVFRKPGENPLGMLRRAIEQGWDEPPESVQLRKQRQRAERERQEAEEERQRDAESRARKEAKRRQRSALLPQLQRMTSEERAAAEQAAFNCLRSNFERQRFRTNDAFREQQTLDELVRRQRKSAES